MKQENIENYRILYERCNTLMNDVDTNRKINNQYFSNEPRTSLKALDLFCCAGGVSYGLWLAGFDVTGVDISKEHLKYYPVRDGMRYIEGNVLDYMNMEFIAPFDMIWASCPCQGFSGLNEANKENFKEGTLQRQEDDRNLFFKVQAFLENCGKPYILENVMATRAHMKNPIMICGMDFGLLTYRHRCFQTNTDIVGTYTAKSHKGRHKNHSIISHTKLDGNMFSIVGHSGKRNFWNNSIGRKVLGIYWEITSYALREAIPPCY